MHVHAVKGDAECRYWLDPDRFDIDEEFEYNSTPRLRREAYRLPLRTTALKNYDAMPSEPVGDD